MATTFRRFVQELLDNGKYIFGMDRDGSFFVHDVVALYSIKAYTVHRQQKLFQSSDGVHI